MTELYATTLIKISQKRDAEVPYFGCDRHPQIPVIKGANFCMKCGNLLMDRNINIDLFFIQNLIVDLELTGKFHCSVQDGFMNIIHFNDQIKWGSESKAVSFNGGDIWSWPLIIEPLLEAIEVDRETYKEFFAKLEERFGEIVCLPSLSMREVKPVIYD